MKLIIEIVIIVYLITLCSCGDNELSQTRINEIDNAFVNSSFNYTYLDSLLIDQKSSYFKCLYKIAISMNDKRIIEGGIAVVYEPDKRFGTYFDTGYLFYFLSKIRRGNGKVTEESYDSFLGKKLDLNYIGLNKVYRSAYNKDLEKKNMWVRLGISIVLTENRYYQEAINYLKEAETINPENNYLKELMINNLLHQGDSITAKVYLNRIPKSYKFNEIDKEIRKTLTHY